MNRRLFIGGLLAAGASAPAIARSGVLMPIRTSVEPNLWPWFSNRRWTVGATTRFTMSLAGDGTFDLPGVPRRNDDQMMRVAFWDSQEGCLTVDTIDMNTLRMEPGGRIETWYR